MKKQTLVAITVISVILTILTGGYAISQKNAAEWAYMEAVRSMKIAEQEQAKAEEQMRLAIENKELARKNMEIARKQNEELHRKLENCK